MGWVDLVIAVLVVGAVVNGLRLGALVQVASFVGFWVGLAVGVGLALLIARPLLAGWGRVGLTLLLVLGLATVSGAAGSVLGRWGAVTLKRWHLGGADAAAGAVVGAASVLFSAWLIAGFFVQVQVGWFSGAIGRSAVLRTVDSIMPPVPSALAQVQSLLSRGGFPPVFAQVVLPQDPQSTQPAPAQTLVIAGPALGSVVKVFSAGCGGYVEGSGFVVAPGVVATNAHVVAGVGSPGIIVGTRSYSATPVLVDPRLDLAVLRTRAPLGSPLSLDTVIEPTGTQAAIIGYPENGGLKAISAAISNNFEALGRDIYGAALVTRQVYEVNGSVLPGASGGPLFGGNGKVLGVVFSRSTVSAGVGYALTASSVAPTVLRGESLTAAVSTGSCPPG